MVKVVKKRRIFYDEADWLPPKGRAFKMKTGGKEEEQEADQKAKPQAAPKAAPQKLYTDSDGLDMAYADQSNMFLDSQGTLYVSGTKGGFLGQEWLENYKTMGVPLIQKMLGLPSDYRIEENERYKQLDDFVKANPGKVKNIVGHSKGSAVIDVWMKTTLNLQGKTGYTRHPTRTCWGRRSGRTGSTPSTWCGTRNTKAQGGQIRRRSG